MPTETTTVEVPKALLERVLIGGNHLALIIGADHPPYTATHDQALEHYVGENHDHDGYGAWCCWRTIMELRDAVNV